MKVILFNGSPHANGSTYTALAEIAKQLKTHDIDSEIVHIGTKPVAGCIACNACRKNGTFHCAFGDVDGVNAMIDKVSEADGLVIGAPVHYAGAAGMATAFMDRVFYAKKSFAFKVGASVASCRRGGASATFDRLNKYFTISCMPVVPSDYWNSIHGNNADEAVQDAEGLHTMRVLADNMAWMLKSFEAAKAAGINPPALEPKVKTSMIR